MKGKVKKIIIYLIVAFFIYVFSFGILPVWIAEKRTISKYGTVTANAENSSVNLQKQIQEGRTASERVRCIDNNEDALEWRIRLIENAERTVNITSFECREDKRGHMIIAALNDAAKRGVKVKILVDSYHGSREIPRDKSFQALMNNPEVEIKVYNPLDPLRLWKVNYRLHDKFLVVDGKTYIAGGRNTNDLFLGEGKGRNNRHNLDRDLLVFSLDEPGSAAFVSKRFDSLWNEKNNKKIKSSNQEDDSELLETMETIKKTVPEITVPLDGNRDGDPVESIVLIFSDSKPVCKKPIIWNELISIMAEGNNVIIQSPYYMGDRKMYKDIMNPNEPYTMILNSPDTGANPWGSSELLFTGRHLSRIVDLYEYYGTSSSHIKTILSGDDISVVGSFNMDIRSVYLDTEMVMVVESERLNEELRKHAKVQMEDSRVLMADGIDLNNIKSNPIKRCFLVIMKIFTLFFHPLL